MKGYEYYKSGLEGHEYSRFYSNSESRLPFAHVYRSQGAGDVERRIEVAKKEEEMKNNIPKRALMIKKVSDDIPALPQLPEALWREIAEYEGGVESSLLGKANNNNENDSWICCNIL
jgi:hypothetical protein